MTHDTERAGFGIGKQNVTDALLKNTVAKINADVQAQTHGAAPLTDTAALVDGTAQGDGTVGRCGCGSPLCTAVTHTGGHIYCAQLSVLDALEAK